MLLLISDFAKLMKMKILILAQYITILNAKNFSRNVTGYGHMVRDIADYVSRTGVHVDVLTSSCITNGRECNAFSLVRRTWIDIILHIRPYYFQKMLEFYGTYTLPAGRLLKALFYSLSAGYVEHVLRQGDYDLVHIHGAGFVSKLFIDCCERVDVKYVVTLHGLNSFGENEIMEQDERYFEKDLFKDFYFNGKPLTVVSTGVLNFIKEYLGVQGEVINFKVVTNGTDVNEKSSNHLDLRSRYNISPNEKIMLAVGNLCERKNQLQIIRAYHALPVETKKKLRILFLGNDLTAGEVGRQIVKFGLEDKLILCGNISRESIGSYYKQADYTILASISEGFGLSIIEGFVYGLPHLTFSDLDAVVDLFNDKAMLTLTDRSDESLAEGIVQMMSVNWDRTYIKEYARNFSNESMAQEYVKIYQAAVAPSLSPSGAG